VFVVSDHDADGSECAANIADGTKVVGAGLKQQRELASESSVDVETARMQDLCTTFSSNSPQITSSPRSETEYLPEHKNRSGTLPSTVSSKVQMDTVDTVSQVISVQGPSASEVPDLANSGNVAKPNVPSSTATQCAYQRLLQTCVR
jgi:hypothetical protein